MSKPKVTQVSEEVVYPRPTLDPQTLNVRIAALRRARARGPGSLFGASIPKGPREATTPTPAPTPRPPITGGGTKPGSKYPREAY